MTNISGNGLIVNLQASVTFPVGFEITQFADDADPFDIPTQTISETAMGLNGDMVVWTALSPIEISISVIPNSDDDKNLSTLFEANRGGKDKRVAKDVITLTGIYPDNKKIQLVNGAIISGNSGLSIASAGRMKSKTYVFRFENKN